MKNVVCLCSVRSRQYLCALSVTLLSTSLYVHISWTSPTIPLLMSSDSPIGVQLTEDQTSWIASLLSAGIIVGSVFTGLIMDKFGRKKALYLSGALLFIPWIIIIFAISFEMLVVARLISGLGAALATGILAIYIGEVSDNDIRGRLSTATPLGSTISSMLVFSIGPFVTYTTLALICGAIPILFFISFFAMPESPYYLVKTNQREAAYEAINSLSKPESVESRLKEIEATVIRDEACKLSLKTLFIQANYRKSLVFVLVLKTIQQFSGIFVINSYLQSIMESSQTSLSPEISSVIFAAIQIPCVAISAFLVDKLGRKPLLVISSAGCAVALIGEGVYFFLMEDPDRDLSSIYFLPTLCLVLFYMFYSVGVGGLSYIFAGEVFASNVKMVGGTMFSFYSGLLFFVSIKIFDPITDAWGMHVAFWIFAVICIFGVFFGLFVLPETKGKSFDEIQTMLHEKKKKSSQIP